MSRVAVVLLFSLIAGAAGAQDAAPPASPLPSVALPAALDRVLRDYERAWRSGNVDSLVHLFTEDGFVLQPGRPPARGRAALREVYTGQGGGDLRLRALEFAASGPVAYIIGAYRYGDTPADVGKFTLTLQRGGDGRWLIRSDMDNGDRPARRPPTPP